MSGVYTGPHSQVCWFSLPSAALDPPPNTAPASALGPRGRVWGSCFQALDEGETKGPSLSQKLGSRWCHTANRQARVWAQKAPLQLPRGPPKPKGANQLSAYLTADAAQSRLGFRLRGRKEREKKCKRHPHPHCTPAILRSGSGHAGSLRNVRSRPPSLCISTQEGARVLDNPSLEAATQARSPGGLGAPKPSRHSSVQPPASRGVG